MTKLTLTNYVRGNTTLLENEFIDEYMLKANGEYVKVYLLLLRYMGEPSVELTISGLADLLECTEKDVARALNYWKKQGLVDYEAGMQEIQDIRRKNRREFKEIVHVTEQYLGKTLTKTESEAIVYFYDELGMSADLIEYLIEYCVENGHKSIHYIKKVALSWADQKVGTTEEAKAVSGQYSKNSYAVLNAYGIKGRAPAAAELVFIRRWNEEYGFSSDLIVEACDRTMKTIHQPSFEYTESILKNWADKGVKTPADVKALDLLYLQEKGAKKAAAVGAARTARNKFNNFEGRKYQDMDELTRRLIETQ